MQMALRFLKPLFFIRIMSINEVRSTRLFSKQEVMDNMTTSHAVSQVLRLQPEPALISMMSNQFRLGRSLRARADPAGYGGVAQARALLNQMITETNKKLDVETIQCDDFEREQHVLMEQLRGDIGSANAAAASARHIVLDSQSEIISLEEKIPETKNSLDEHEWQCKNDIAEMKSQLLIVNADINVVGSIINMTDCNKESALMLAQCVHCATGTAYMSLSQRHIGDALGNLKSKSVRQSIAQSLAQTYAESASSAEPVEIFDGEEAQFPPNQLNTTDVPQRVLSKGCEKTNKCSLASNPNCPDLQDRFMRIQGGMVDMKEDMEDKLSDRQNECGLTGQRFKTQISDMETTHNSELARLAEGTKKQVESERQSHEFNDQHQAVEGNFHKRMKSCCDNKNQFLSEVCALEKIRGELLKMKGEEAFIQDCEVSEWVKQPCSATCGGGKMISTRSITLEPEGGAMCPALRLEEDCNMESCPVDCVLEDWSGWSSCTAECGGGVKERQRQLRTEPKHHGEPCGETLETVSCNVQSCDGDCELSDWTKWAPCTKACDGGVQERYRDVIKPAQGEGWCPELFSEERLGERSCNTFSCDLIAPKKVLSCKSTLDLIILMDGSASLKQDGWKAAKEAAKHLVSSMEGGKVNLAFLLYSGPWKYTQMVKCAYGKGNPDLEKDCQMKWVSRFTNSTADVLPLIDEMKWPRKTTLTSMALSLAREELTYGRRNTRAAVLVITDGKPMSKRSTGIAARRLQKVAQVAWVLVGPRAPTPKYVMEKRWASKPFQNNIVKVPRAVDLDAKEALDQMVSDVCPVVA